MLSFCSNDYLGLASHPAIKQRFIDVIESDGAGSGAAHLLTGHSTHHQALEEALADFTGQPRALLFSTGYMANMGVIDALVGRGDVVIQDKWNHASLLDGARLSDADMMRFPHVDMAQLHKRLHQSAAVDRKLIVTDGVFSMDGDIAPLPEIMALAKQHQAAVMVDDAHGIGVIGRGGRGSVSHFELSGDAQPIIVGMLGKALGTAGAFVAADEVVIETLTQHARSYVYTTAQPAAIAAATLKSLEVLEKESWRHEQLEANIALFRSGAHALGLKLMASETPIQPLIVGDDQLTLTLGQQLEEKGILVGVIRTPTVPKNTARLRVTISAAHTEADIQQLLTALEQVHAS
jgi:8-amino-7-oxononanoate synthase